MRCPCLAELPAPPSGRNGWPWTIESAALPDTMPGGERWPKISLVVASLNHGAYIEEMIRSALLQGYPDLEFILVDGGSDSGTLDVIRKYGKWFAYFVSEPDRGQSNALNKGLARMSGELFNNIDTDDYFLPGCLGLVAQASRLSPGKIVACDVVRVWEGSAKTEIHFPKEIDLHAYAKWWESEHHGGPGIFFPAACLSAVGWVEESLHYSMDYEFMLRYLQVADITTPHFAAAVIRNHPACKSVKNGDYCVWECMQVSKRYQKLFPDIDAVARRHSAGMLFGFGVRRLLYGQGDSWRFIREGWRTHPFWAVYWLVPGWFLRKWSRLAG
jgi:glycosyltransferase involved in cell wall biosynthesis